MNKTELLNKCARSGEERVLLARAWISWRLPRTALSPPAPHFSPRERQASVTDLLNAWGAPAPVFRRI